MLIVRCKECNKELMSLPKTQVCGCPNMMQIKNDKITAVDLAKVVVVQNENKDRKKSILTSEDLQFQENRKRRKVKKLNFEIR